MIQKNVRNISMRIPESLSNATVSNFFTGLLSAIECDELPNNIII